MAPPTILVVYDASAGRLPHNVEQHLRAWQRHAGGRAFYVDLGTRGLPRSLVKLHLDLIVFHTTFLAARWVDKSFARLVERALPLARYDCVKIALPQDEFTNTASLEEFLSTFGVQHVFSVAPESEWPKIYPRMSRSKVAFHRVLTGYLEGDPGPPGHAPAPTSGRVRDIGYRVRPSRMWLGRAGLLKTQIAERASALAPALGLTVDVSCRMQDTLWGARWSRFLAQSKYTLGAEGGSSLHDSDGALRRRVDAYLEAHPGARFPEVEAQCFPGRDGELHLVALSPRHLEACRTRTCQILVRGDYNGLLQAGRHYLPVMADLSDLNDVLEEARRDKTRADMVECAYVEIACARKASYQSFVELVSSTVGLESVGRHREALVTPSPDLALAMNRAAEYCAASVAMLRRRCRDVARRLVGARSSETVLMRLARLSRRRAP